MLTNIGEIASWMQKNMQQGDIQQSSLYCNSVTAECITTLINNAITSEYDNMTKQLNVHFSISSSWRSPQNVFPANVLTNQDYINQGGQ